MSKVNSVCIELHWLGPFAVDFDFWGCFSPFYIFMQTAIDSGDFFYISFRCAKLWFKFTHNTRKFKLYVAILRIRLVGHHVVVCCLLWASFMDFYGRLVLASALGLALLIAELRRVS